MDFQHALGSGDVKDEVLTRLDEIVEATEKRRPGSPGGAPGGGLEGLHGLDGLGADGMRGRLLEAVDQMSEGAWSEQDRGLEAIIERFTRPVMIVQDDDFAPPEDDFPDSQVVLDALAAGRDELLAAIPSTGRLDLKNHRMPWAGTAWLVAPGLAVTNRHVAQLFATHSDGGFSFRRVQGGGTVGARIDRYHEFDRGTESVVRVREIVWIEPDDGYDAALLRVDVADEDDKAWPQPIALMSAAEVEAVAVGRWVGVIGYPMQSPYNDAQDQQRIFDGIYGVKRVAPGTVLGRQPNGIIKHDATTLGGNSGSVVLDLTSGKALALHFGGIEGESNSAVAAPVIAQLVADHA